MKKLANLSYKWHFNQFSANVPTMDKPGSWFLPLKYHSSTGVFKDFGSKNQLPGFFISWTLFENELKHLEQLLFKKRFPKLLHGIITRIDINFIVHYLHVYI